MDHVVHRNQECERISLFGVRFLSGSFGALRRCATKAKLGLFCPVAQPFFQRAARPLVLGQQRRQGQALTSGGLKQGRYELWYTDHGHELRTSTFTLDADKRAQVKSAL